MPNRKPMREHDRLSAAIAAGCEQFERGGGWRGGLRLRALRCGLPTKDIVSAYGTTMSESSAGRIATGRIGVQRQLAGTG
jgi:hypothetical protein